RSRRSKAAWTATISGAPSAARRSRRSSWSARSARRGCASRAPTVVARSRRCGRSARTARRRSSTIPARRPFSPRRSARRASADPANRARRVAVEQTLILAKPDAVERNLAGEILARFERRGLKLRAARFLVASRELGETHYAEHRERPFFGELVEFITSGPTLAFVLEGEGPSATARKTIGPTNPADADPAPAR